MPATISRRRRLEDEGVVLEQELTTPTAVTDPVLLSGEILAQVTGANANATVTYIVERSTRNPAGGSPNWAGIASSAGAVGVYWVQNGGDGPVKYQEPAAAWWRIRLTQITNGPALATISGQGARVGA